MLCQIPVKCANLQYCQGAYAVLNIGELEDNPYSAIVQVLFTSTTTGKITILDNAASGQTVSVDTENFTPIAGHTYQVQVVLSTQGGGLAPARFFPYTLVDGSFDLSTTAYDAASVRFVKVFTPDNDADTAAEQFLSV